MTATSAKRKPARKAAETTDKAAARRTTQRVIPVDRIDPDPDQPRKHFDPAKLQELADSIKELGVLQPVSVRFNPATRRYTLIMGERRWRASRMAGLAEIPAVIEHGLDDRETFARSVAENVGRADMTPIEEARAFQKLTADPYGYSVEEVGKLCGKSPAYVGWRIDLLNLCEPAQDALTKGHLPVGLSWYVAQLNPTNQTRFLAKWTRGDFPTIRDAEAFAQAARAEEQRQEQQGSFFVLADETAGDRTSGGQDALPGSLDIPEDERERIVADRKRLVGKIDKLSVAGEILSTLATTKPEELALLLSGTPGGVAGHRQRIEHLRDVAMKAMKNLREAQAIAAVRASALEINPAAAAE